MEALINIQSRLNAPKNLNNKFGGYNYRSAESILEAVKPLLKEFGCQLTISDDIISAEGRVYIKATASITDGKETVSVNGFAREEESKKGMDSAQLTGATSSYARKYALNGLFCIDNNKDPDTDEYAKQTSTNAKLPAKSKLPDGKSPVVSLLEEAIAAANNANDKATILEVWKKYASLQSNPEFSKYMSARRKALGI